MAYQQVTSVSKKARFAHRMGRWMSLVSKKDGFAHQMAGWMAVCPLCGKEDSQAAREVAGGARRLRAQPVSEGMATLDATQSWLKGAIDRTAVHRPPLPLRLPSCVSSTPHKGHTHYIRDIPRKI